MSIRLLILLTLSTWVVLGQESGCTRFLEKYNDAKTIESIRKHRDKNLEDKDFIQEDEDLGYERSEIVPCRNASSKFWYDYCNADLYTMTARLVADKDVAALSTFENNNCLKLNTNVCKSRPKYRQINNYCNNLKNPLWGNTGAPFGRFGPKNYADGVHSTRRSVTGNHLPGARSIVTNILMKCEKFPRKSRIPNDMANFAVLYITHDIGNQVPVGLPTKGCEDMRCCTHLNRGILSKTLRNSACLPIAIGNDDPFYKNHNVKCLNFVRSQMSSLPSKTQFGEIKNKATGFLDLSLIYGNEWPDTKEIRSFTGGKLNMNGKKVFAVDSNGEYTKISDRSRAVPSTAVWPSLFTRNHNKLAEELARINPKWNDEKLFHEARRINIAILQSISYSANFIFESPVTGTATPVDEKYDENLDVSSNLEFHSAVYRYFHFYVNTAVQLVDKDNVVTNKPLSETFGNIEYLEDNFDAIVKGMLSQNLNFGEYTAEMTNNFAKNHDGPNAGVGVDVISFDIQRGRDHGLPTYLQTRKQCGLKSDYKTFNDLTELFPQSYVDMLKAEYDSVEDIDLIVGGSLESYLNVDKSLFGETFDCINRDQFKRVMAGDAYFFTHPQSPHPFTAAQIKAIKEFTFNHLVCVNTGVDSVPQSSFYVADDSNPKIPCSQFKPMSCDAWKNV